ncbi:MAG: hypothetical protein PHN64_03985 [Desulfovibrionaceae bacterium]|jgi:hypothetical protein|nr:hypothetical protein [Desulfovibrionaceae bacterium]
MEQRESLASLSIRIAGKSTKIELFSAEEWDGDESSVRIRQDGKWLAGTHGKQTFFSLDDAFALVRSLSLGEEACLESPQNMPTNFTRGLRCSVPNGNYDGRDNTRIDTEQPFRGYDGRWYIGCYVIGRGTVLVPCDDVIIKK